MSADELLPKHVASAATKPRIGHTHAMQEAVTPSLDVLHPGRRATRRTRTDPPRTRGNALLSVLLVVVLGLIAAAGAGLYYLDRSYQGKIYPNVTIQGIQVGELTPEQATAAVQKHHAAFLAQPVTLTLGDQLWQPTAQELGLRFDVGGAVEQAYRAGRGNGLIANLQSVAAIWQNGLELPLQAEIDQREILQYVQGIAADVDQEPKNAQLNLIGTSITSGPMQVGRQVLVNETMQALTDSLATFTPQTVAVQVRPLQPRLRDAEVEAARTQLAAYLQGPLTLNAAGKQYVWSPEEIALMLKVARVPRDEQTDGIAIEFSQYQINKRVAAIANEIGRGSVHPRVDWNGGNLQIIKPGRSGQRLDEEAASTSILAAIGSPERTVELPVLEVTPQVTEANLNSLGINELVAVGRSDFSGSAPYRVTNIGAGMRLLHGILLAPGEEFSFNRSIGSVSPANGFVEGHAIIQNRVQLEYGGGICQDSTTMFRAAFWAGLPITERWGHSFYISWYDKYALGPNGNGPGMDSTIFLGGPDLKFVNDTGNWLLIQTMADPVTGVAEVAMYGTKVNRSVQLTGYEVYNRTPPINTPVYVPDPKQPRGRISQTDTARGGMTIDVYRVITENGVRQQPELFRTVFKPWANKFSINPADLGANGRPIQRAAPPPPPEAPAPAPAAPAPVEGQAPPPGAVPP